MTRTTGRGMATALLRRDGGETDSLDAVVVDHHGITGSMGRVGAAGDNAAMESFFALLQKNVLNRRRWATRAELRLAITRWIERTYHRRRRQHRLGRMTPIEYETAYAANTLALAA